MRRLGKHSLKHDSIFKGKKDAPIIELSVDSANLGKPGDVHRHVGYFDEIHNGPEVERLRQLEKVIYNIILDKIKLNLDNNRRKPSKVDFNGYIDVLFAEIDLKKFTKIEIFVTLSYYFSENLFNMFKLLDRRHSMDIIEELDKKFNLNKFDGMDSDFV